MNQKLNKTQWVAVISALLVTIFFLWVSLDLSSPPSLEEMAEEINEENEEVVNQEKNTPDFSQITIIKEGDSSVRNLVTEDIVSGNGKEAVKGKVLTVNYAGFLLDNTKFDSSWDRGIPFELRLGDGSVIPGWEEGLVGMKEGGLRRLVIPAWLAYGNNQVGPIPPDSTLVFVVELIEVRE